jgi:hypothetical protein
MLVVFAGELPLTIRIKIAPYLPSAVLKPITLLAANRLIFVEVPVVILFLTRVLMAPEEVSCVLKFTPDSLLKTVTFFVQLKYRKTTAVAGERSGSRTNGTDRQW